MSGHKKHFAPPIIPIINFESLVGIMILVVGGKVFLCPPGVFMSGHKKHSGQMAINSEIQPRRPRNDLLLEILSKSALALALEGLQTAPRASAFYVR